MPQFRPEPQRDDDSAPKGRPNEAQASGLGLDAIPMQFHQPQRADDSAPKGRPNEAQANSLGLEHRPNLPLALKGRKM
jgi:hypothetical protein